jgi:hypothetical protein
MTSHKHVILSEVLTQSDPYNLRGTNAASGNSPRERC